jgi:hypothetical protein
MGTETSNGKPIDAAMPPSAAVSPDAAAGAVRTGTGGLY